MCNNKDLGQEFREVMEESKALMLTTAMSSSVLTMNEDDIVTNAKALRLLNRALDLCVEVFDKQNRLMDKMDELMDKYL